MRRRLGIAATALVVFAAGATPASASTTVAWSASIAEQIGGPIHSPFDCPANSPCGSGSGQVNPFGRADDLIVFQACGSECDVRTLTFADGSTIVMYETFSNFQTPGGSAEHPNPKARVRYGNPFSGDLSDTIVGGTGRFAGATGAASGTIKVAGGVATIKLSGSILY